MEMWKRNLFICWIGAFATASALSQIAPILPLYVEHLGVSDLESIEMWSGLAFGITGMMMALVSPLWGQAADRFGRKAMLLRASLGMAIVLFFMSFVTSVYQLVGLRLLMGTISGFNSGAITLIATQTPRDRAGWALGTLSTGMVGGSLLGPLIGGFLAEFLGVRSVFLSTSVLLLIAFALTLCFVKENFTLGDKKIFTTKQVWQMIPQRKLLLSMFLTTYLLSAALFSIEPIITVYIKQLMLETDHVALISGLVFAASGLASMISAPRLGKLSDKIGPEKVMTAALFIASLLFIPQAFVKNEWQLLGLRFLLGLATAALLPSVNTLIKRTTPDQVTGRIFGYNQSAQFLGMFSGSVLGGQTAAFLGIRSVFFVTSLLMLINACWVYFTVLKVSAAQKIKEESSH
ncbi:MAG: multidrug efflux MFS transporter [Sporomusaceae bacterium]|nr:multidrug efflux MFS transporter [Sporomusaceae bacterium]